MAMVVEVGLTPKQALRAMTIWGVEVMTARDRAYALITHYGAGVAAGSGP